MDKSTSKRMTPTDRKNLKLELDYVGDGKIGMDIFHLIKSRYKILYIRSVEEARVIETLKTIVQAEGFDLYQWDCSRGLLDSFNKQKVKSSNNEVHEYPVALMSHIVEHAKNDNKKMKKENLLSDGHVYMLLDFHLFLRGDGGAELQRKFKEFFETSSVCCIVIIAPVFECPESLEKEFTLIDFPYPSKHELRAALLEIADEVPDNYPRAKKMAQDREEDLISAAAGLTVVEAENAYALSLVKKKTFDIPTIINEKKQIIRKSGILEFRDARFTFDNVGGLETLKDWLRMRRMAFNDDAAKYGLPAPKGALLVGIPGTGKSMICDALSSYWEMPLLRLDMGSIFASHIGESEGNMRKVIQTAEAIAPCLLWADEIEKGIGGVQSSNMTDGGVTNRVFGTLLTWMQEKESPVFIICTANDVLQLPPEFMRAGRFDEIFFLDLPDHDQRIEVTECILKKKNRNPSDFRVNAIANVCENYSPAEIEKAINNGLFVAYADSKRPVTTDDIVFEASKFQPLYNSRREEVEALREWALGDDGSGGRAVLANKSTKDDSVQVVVPGRNLDLSEDDL